MVAVKIIADSINPAGARLTSWILKYPRFIHSEMLTHRVFSRSAASSRAIPFEKMLKAVIKEPALPEYWAKEHKGMSPSDCFTPTEVQWEDERGDGMVVLRGIGVDYKRAIFEMASRAEDLNKRGLAKSLANRLIEPGAHIEVLVTAHDFNNFFSLRADKDAMPEFQVLAYRMLAKYLASTPKPVRWDDWHIPQFVEDADGYQGKSFLELDELAGLSWEGLLKVATARCARLSYLTHEGKHDINADFALYERILSSRHMGPFEHCAQAVKSDSYPWSNFDNPRAVQGSMDNDGGLIIEGLSHWMQYRKTIEGENRTNADLNAIMATKPAWITLL